MDFTGSRVPALASPLKACNVHGASLSNRTTGGIGMKSGILAAGAVVVALAAAPQAQAGVAGFVFSGAGLSGHGLLTVTPDTVVGDPSGAYTITGISGSFSDSNLGISNAAITPLVAINPVSPPRGAPVPVSMSLYSVVNPPPHDSAISYDNLFYPDGSPVTCGGYPLFGGPLDVYGVMFTLSNGDIGELFSNGGLPGKVPVTFGGVVISGNTVLDFQSTGVSFAVPEPDSLWLLGVGLLGVMAWRRGKDGSALRA